MAVQLLSTLFDFTPGTIVRDLSYDIERRLVARGAATYDLSGGTLATVPTLNPSLTQEERDIVMLEELLLTNRNTSTLEPFAVSDWVLQGLYDYNDLATQTTPLAITAAGGFTDIPNDGGGSFTNKTYSLPGVADLWSIANQQFEWTDLNLGDRVDIRLDLEVTTTQPNQEVEVVLQMAVGSGNNYSIPFIKQAYKTAGAQNLNRFNGVYMGDANTLNFPSKFQIRSDDNASVLVRGWYATVLPRFAKFQL